MDHLAHHDVVCPQPMRRENGDMLAQVSGKPSCIVTRLAGTPRMSPDVRHCREAGAILGRIHVGGVEYDASLENSRGREWRERFALSVGPRLSPAENALIESENRYQGLHDDTVLPTGIIHGDLFRDNVLWDDGDRGGVIDFYFACDDLLLYDLAIAVNDWCVTPAPALDPKSAAAFIEGYESERPLEDLEREMWPVMLRRAALRTWLGRLGYAHFPRESEMTIAKDHAFSRRLLEEHVANARALA
jgi:homoserine kinase type II